MARGKSAREVRLDLKRFGKVTREQASQIFRKIALDLDSAIVLDTPVLTGRARGNWYPSIGAPSNAEDPEVRDKSGTQAIGRLSATVAGAMLGDVIWFTNNLPYILELENGRSNKSPDGMVDVNVERVRRQLS